jgi:hypothetical protein
LPSTPPFSTVLLMGDKVYFLSLKCSNGEKKGKLTVQR